MIESKKGWTARRLADLLGPWLVLMVLVIATAYLEKRFTGESHFLSPQNVLNILNQWSFVGILAIGMTLVISSGGIDLSVGSMAATAGGIGIWLMNTCVGAAKVISRNDAARLENKEMAEAGLAISPLPSTEFREWLARKFIAFHWNDSETMGITLAILAAIVIATFWGWINGLLIAKGRLAPFIATLGGLAAYRSLGMVIVDSGAFSAEKTEKLLKIGSGGLAIPGLFVNENTPVRISYASLTFFLVALIAWIIATRTRYGRYVCAVGSNERAALYSAIPVDRIKIYTYTIMGLLAGITGFLLAARTTSITSSSTATLYELDAIAAVVIGGTRMQGGLARVWGTVVGVLMLGVIGSMLSFLNVSVHWQGFVKGCIIVAAALLQQIGRKRA